jgi:hypothetical protein
LRPFEAPLSSSQHITHHCYRYHWERATAGINLIYHSRLVPFNKILGPTKKNPMHLLTFKFIQESRAFAAHFAWPETGFRNEPD